MSFIKNPTSLTDCYIIEPQVFGDSRGFFMETYSQTEFTKIGIRANFVQDNHSKSKKGVLRGLHFQTRRPQAKLVRVTAGSVYDVVVDLRRDSPTFGKWEGFVLSAENKKQLFIPRGFAHGFLTLEDDTEFLYKCDDVYDPGHEGGLIWDDTDLAIDWHKYIDEYTLGELVISEKDKKNKTFLELEVGEVLFSIREKGWYDGNIKKQQLDLLKTDKKVKEGEVWWLYCGLNIGSEINGKGDEFMRPAIIYKKLSKTQFLVIPTSTQEKVGTWFIPFSQSKKKYVACLHQTKIIDIRRLRNRQSSLDNADFLKIRKGFTELYT